MNDLKITIARSFSRKLNLGNYQTADFFASYSQEILATSGKEIVKALSNSLHKMAREDVEHEIAEFKKEKIKAEKLDKAKLDVKIDLGSEPLIDEQQ